MGRSDNLRRSGWSREPLARYLIVCEGAITEKSYFSDLRHLERIPI